MLAVACIGTTCLLGGWQGPRFCRRLSGSSSKYSVVCFLHLAESDLRACADQLEFWLEVFPWLFEYHGNGVPRVVEGLTGESEMVRV